MNMFKNTIFIYKYILREYLNILEHLLLLLPSTPLTAKGNVFRKNLSNLQMFLLITGDKVQVINLNKLKFFHEICVIAE